MHLSTNIDALSCRVFEHRVNSISIPKAMRVSYLLVLYRLDKAGWSLSHQAMFE